MKRSGQAAARLFPREIKKQVSSTSWFKGPSNNIRAKNIAMTYPPFLVCEVTRAGLHVKKSYCFDALTLHAKKRISSANFEIELI